MENDLSNIGESLFNIRNDGVTGHLVGGFGNQLFIAAAAWSQAARLKCPLYFNLSWFEKNKDREFGLSGLGLPYGADDASQTNLILKSVNRIAAFSKRGDNNFQEKSFEYDAGINSVTRGAELKGYFQSYRYFENIAPQLVAAFEEAGVPEREADLISTLSAEPFLAIHVRRGDYFTNPETRKFHGLCSVNYFMTAIGCVQKDIVQLKRVLVFTDSPELVKSEFGTQEGFVYVSDYGEISELATLKLMSKAQSIVISNSSFSWWGAWLCKQKNPNAIVVAPNPWFSSNQNVSDLLPQDWVVISSN
jgi:hypothetical protein